MTLHFKIWPQHIPWASICQLFCTAQWNFSAARLAKKLHDQLSILTPLNITFSGYSLNHFTTGTESYRDSTNNSLELALILTYCFPPSTKHIWNVLHLSNIIQIVLSRISYLFKHFTANRFNETTKKNVIQLTSRKRQTNKQLFSRRYSRQLRQQNFGFLKTVTSFLQRNYLYFKD